MIIMVISFMIHIFTILAIVILYQRRSLERLNLPSLEEDVETIHQSIESFIDEIEKENETLYQKIAVHIETKEKELMKKIADLEKELQKTVQLQAETPPLDTVLSETKFLTKEADHLPKMERVIELYKQGFSVELISKTLNIGKGEVSLMINLLEKADQF